MFDRQQSIGEAIAVDISSDDQAFPPNKPTRAIYIGSSSGVLSVELVNNPGVAMNYTVLAGSRHPLRVSKVFKAGTTVTGIIAEF